MTEPSEMVERVAQALIDHSNETWDIFASTMARPQTTPALQSPRCASRLRR